MNEAAAIAQALARLTPAARNAFLNAIRRIRSAAQVTLIIEHLKAGNVEAAVAAASIDSNFFFPLDQVIRDAFETGGTQALKAVEKQTNPLDGSSISLGFSGRHPRAELWSQTTSRRLIVEITEDQREMARSVILKGLQDGKGAQDIARSLVGTAKPGSKDRIGGFIGLTTQQAGFAMNMEEELARGDYAAYFNRQRRDKRYDRLIRGLQASGKPLAPGKIDEIVGRYKDKLLALRGETIARTETLTALGAGRHEGYQQLVDSGQVHDSQIQRIWDATMDKRTRLDHVVLDAQTRKEPLIGLNSVFEIGGSQMRFPRDRSLGAAAKETINCRCFETVRIDYLNGPGAGAGAKPEPVTEAPSNWPSEYADKLLNDFNAKDKRGNRHTKEEKARLREILSPFKSEADFLSLFGGDTQDYKSTRVKLSPYSLIVQASEGQKGVNEIVRTFSLTRRSVEHDYLIVDKEAQGAGVAKEILSRSVAAYPKMGIESVGVHANIDVGGYAWAKYGFTPSPGSWEGLRGELKSFDLGRLGLDETQRKAVGALLDSPDPRAIWEISDLPALKPLLIGSDWVGSLDLTDPLAMERFNRYVGPKTP